jgi:hypothetical protein
LLKNYFSSGGSNAQGVFSTTCSCIILQRRKRADAIRHDGDTPRFSIASAPAAH